MTLFGRVPSTPRAHGALAVGIGLVALACGEAASSRVAAPTPAAASSSTQPPPTPPLSARRDRPSSSSASTAPAASSAPPPAPPTAHEADDETGGECVASTFPGTCVATADGTFTFEGEVDGKSVTLKGNTFYGKPPASRPSAGKEQPCHLRLSKSGTCTPCTLSLGSCGGSALDLHRGRP